MRTVKNPRQRVEFNGKSYALKSRRIKVPDFTTMSEIESALWILRNTTARGYSQAAAESIRLGGAVSVGVRQS